MKQEVLTRFPWPALPSFALLIFFVFFVGLIVSLFINSRRSDFESAEALPLHDGDKL